MIIPEPNLGGFAKSNWIPMEVLANPLGIHERLYRFHCVRLPAGGRGRLTYRVRVKQR
jgi:hypothetical protein